MKLRLWPQRRPQNIVYVTVDGKDLAQTIHAEMLKLKRQRGDSLGML